MAPRRFLNTKPALNTATGVLFAVIAGLLLLGSLHGGGGGGEILDVPTAAMDIQPGTVVAREMVGVTRVARGYMVPGTLLDRSEVTGARALRFIGRGEPFTSAALALQGSAGTLSSRIPSDLRAYSLRLGSSSAAGADICAGDRVDVLSTRADPPGTVTLLGQRLVLSAGAGRGPGGEDSPDRYGVLTLLVSPSEAEMLAQAECTGEISVSLCPAGE